MDYQNFFNECRCISESVQEKFHTVAPRSRLILMYRAAESEEKAAYN